MQKKIILALASTLFTSSVLAQSAFEGFYGQIGIGYQSLSDKATNATFNVRGSPITHSQSVTDVTPQGFAGNIALGYNKAITDNFLLGLGVEYSPIGTNQASRTITTSFGASSQGWLKLNDYYNIFITPTYAIDTDRAVYLKAGWSQANTSNPYTSYNQSGVSLGLGYKQFFHEGWYGFVEANYIMYGNTTYSFQVPMNDARGTGTSTSTNSGNLFTGLVGVGYKF